MSIDTQKINFPPIPDKRYFTISEVARLCQTQQHVLRYWEQYFPSLKPMRRGNRRYYQRQDIYLIRQIQDLLQRQRYTMDGARRQLTDGNIKSEWAYNQQIIGEIRDELRGLLKFLRE